MNFHVTPETGGLIHSVQSLQKFGTTGYAVMLHLRGLSCRMVERTYPQEWVEHYNANGYALRDPIVGWCLEHEGVARWSNPDLPDPYGIMKRAAEFGLGYGAAVSIGPRNCRSIINIARSDRELSEEELREFEQLSLNIHRALPLEIELTVKQIEAIECVAAGMRMKQAAAFIGISDSALKFRFRAIREKLSARTNAEAIQRAKDYDLI